MTLSGLSDSIASVIADAPSCPRCDSSSHVAGGLCVGCLLQSGLDPDGECEPEALLNALAEINLPDQNWRLGNYEILEEIGRGGMGVIYRARQRHSRRIVAVKRVLSYHSDSHETLARFRREAQAAASLDHPNILPIYEVSESEDGLPFFSMKFAPGGNLQEVGPALRNDPRQCVALVAKVARAVQHAHAKGILHRDLKPGNILLDARGEPLVSDFGLAKWLDTTSELTRTLTIFGTPGYIAPEQAGGPAAELKPTADVYSLGAILFDLLAGRPPFLGAHALSVIRQAAEFPAPKLRTLSKIADRDLETICAHCLDRDPKLRYPSAHDLAEDLERWLEGQPIIARRVSPAERVWRWSRRNQRLAATIGTCLILGGVLGGVQIQSRLATRAAVAATHSIAVAPLLDLETAQFDSKLSAALAAALQRELATYGPARVAALSDRAGARTVMRGTIRLQDGKLRLCLRLLNGADEKVLYHRTMESADGVDPATTAAKLIGLELYRLLDAETIPARDPLGGDPGWQDASTRELLVAGRALYERRSVLDHDRAIELFERAVKAQPQSALAHSYLAEAQSGRAFLTGEQSNLLAADASAQKACNLAPNFVKAHVALAVVRYRQGRFRESLEETYQAWDLSDTDEPRFANRAADSLRKLGRPDRAVAWYRFGLGKESRPGWNEFALGDCLTELAADDEAAIAYRRSSSLFPELPEGWIGLCRIALLQRDFATAGQIAAENWTRYREFIYSQQMAAQVAFFSRNFPEAENLYAELATRDPRGGGTFFGAVSYLSALGHLRLASGAEEEGRRLLREALAQEQEAARVTPGQLVILYRLAAIWSSLGEREPALHALRESVEAGWIDYRSLSLDPRFDSIRSDEAFGAIVATLESKVAQLRTGK
jgi:tetratricopeptide (TPR) repeat protein/tRNA A-37 threonylcarbamoyl transferase component Bud32